MIYLLVKRRLSVAAGIPGGGPNGGQSGGRHRRHCSGEQVRAVHGPMRAAMNSRVLPLAYTIDGGQRGRERQKERPRQTTQ